MSMQKRLGVAALAMFASCAYAAFPERELTGVIQWGAGGGTDVVARSVAPHAEQALGKKIIMVNKPGGVGAIATNYVYNAPSDGYTLLLGAENPQVNPVMGIGELDYSKFYPVNILARGVAVIVVKADAPWKTLKDLIQDAQKRPGMIKMGSTGPGATAHMVGAMLTSITKYKVIAVPFDGDGPGTTAVMGGHVDFMPVGAGSAVENIKAGRLRGLAVISAEPFDALPGVPPVTQEYPEFNKYLPWGAFYGVFVKRDTPKDAIDTLEKAFKTAANNAQFKQIMADRANVWMNISGAEADAFLKQWQSVTAWLLHDIGATKVSPEKFGIPKP